MNKHEDRLSKLKRFHRERGRLPSLAELAGLLGFQSKNSAKYLVDRWVADGVLSRDSVGRLAPGRLFRPVRLLGSVAAGFPSPAEEEMADTISLDDWLIENREASFLLKVTGDSMIEAGIMPGDMVILTRGKTPKNGDVVVAEVDQDWTIKYFQKQGAKVRLVPANRRYKPIEPREELRLAGVVTAVIRRYGK